MLQLEMSSLRTRIVWRNSLISTRIIKT